MKERTIVSHRHLRLGTLLALSLGVSLGGSLPLPGPAAHAADAPAPTFDPIAFFSGRTEGDGTLDEVMASPKATHVTGVGSLRAGGLFVMDQTLEIEGDPTKQRHWQLRETGPNRFSGTLSDATGPVTGTITANRMRIRYTMEGGLKVDSVLTLAPDGRSARNSVKIRKFGIVVATVAETIRKV